MELPLAAAAGEIAAAARGGDRGGCADEGADEERPQSRSPVFAFHGTIVGMQATPDDLDTGMVLDALRRGWSLEAEEAVYAPLGAGSYHWTVGDANGGRSFVTVDDLAQKAWLGDTRDETFAGLWRAFDVAVALRAHGLDFVVAPRATRCGDSVDRLDGRYSIAVFPFVEGGTSARGRYDDDGEREDVVGLIAAVHLATPAVGVGPMNVIGLELPGRGHIERALAERGVRWTGGPFSEPARAAVQAAASDLSEILARADRLAREADGDERRWVLTHGEPHAANVIRAGDGLRLVDWDTVALAPPERDLWMLIADAPDLADVYRDATGTELDPSALEYFRISWDLRDAAEHIDVLRSPHEENDDTTRAYEALALIRTAGGGLRA